MILDIFAAQLPWQCAPDAYLCSDLGGMDGGVDGSAGGPGGDNNFGGTMDRDHATIDTASVGADGGMQFSGADAMALGSLGVAGAIAAASAYGGSMLGVASAFGGLGLYDAEHAGAIGTAMDHAVHDLGDALGNVAAMGDPMSAGLGIFGADSIDAVMASNGGVGAEIADNGAVVMRSANGAYIAAESYNAVYFDHGGTG